MNSTPLKSGKRPIGLNQLPVEILLKVFRHCPNVCPASRVQRFVLAHLRKSWMALTQPQLTLIPLAPLNSLNVPIRLLVSKTPCSVPNVLLRGVLDVTNETGGTLIFDSKAVCKRLIIRSNGSSAIFPHVQSLTYQNVVPAKPFHPHTLSIVSWGTWRGLSNIVTSSLTVLKIALYHRKAISIDVSSLRRLRSLSIYGKVYCDVDAPWKRSEVSIKGLNTLTQLTELRLADEDHFDQECLPGPFQRLEETNPQQSLPAITCLTNLQTLSIPSISGTQLPHAPGLRELRFYCAQTASEGRNVWERSQLPKFKKLRTLRLTDPPDVRPSPHNRFPNIRTLEIGNAGFLPIAKIREVFPNLSRLTLFHGIVGHIDGRCLTYVRPQYALNHQGKRIANRNYEPPQPPIVLKPGESTDFKVWTRAIPGYFDYESQIDYD